MNYRQLKPHEAKLLSGLTLEDIARIPDVTDRRFTESLVRLASSPYFRVSDDQMSRLTAVLASRSARSTKGGTSSPRKKRTVTRSEATAPRPKPKPSGSAPYLIQAPRGVWSEELEEYRSVLREAHLAPGRLDEHALLEVEKKLLAHPVRQKLYRQQPCRQTIVGVLPFCWPDHRFRWTVCPIGVTNHCFERWKERCGLPQEDIIPHMAAAVPLSETILLKHRATWPLIASVLLPRDQFGRLRIGDAPPDLALKNEHGISLLSRKWSASGFKGYTAVTYVPLPG